MVTRRNFLGLMLGAATAPAIVRSESLMKIFVPHQKKIIIAADFDGDVIASIYPKEMLIYNVPKDFAEAVLQNNQALMDHIGEDKLLVRPQYYQDEFDLQTLVKRIKGQQNIEANRFIDEMVKKHSFLQA